MKILAVDDEELALENLLVKLREVKPEAIIKGFSRPEEALEELRNGFVANVAFLDIEMYGMNGIEVACRFKKEVPEMNIIFVTGFSKYAADAFALRASGYITKPVRVERIREELENLRNPIKESPMRIRAQTFGNFEIFVDGEPLKFKRSRTKELLAYLIDRRGAGLTMAEIASVLWEDRLYDRSLQNQLQVHISDLIKTLKAVNATELIYKKHNSISVNTECFDCDYYRFLAGDIGAINMFHGEYMSNYSWAEFTAGQLYIR